MLKIVISSPSVFRKLMKFRRLRPWFPFDLSRLHQVNDESTFVFALQATRLPNGTCKTTNSLRFGELDDAICQHAANFSKPISVHDVAASDGITTVNLSDALNRHGIDHNVVFSDKFSNLYSRRLGLSRIVYDQEGTLVYAQILGFLASEHLPGRFWLSRFLGRFYDDRYERRENEQEILLVNPLARARIAQHKLEFYYYDLFESDNPGGLYQIVRCMNALNPAIFESRKLAKALKKLVNSLDEKGLLIVGRTDPNSGDNHASIFQMNASGLEVVEQIGSSSEIESLVLDAARQVKI